MTVATKPAPFVPMPLGDLEFVQAPGRRAPPSPRPSLAFDIRPIADADRGYALDTWCESYKRSPDCAGMNWRMLKRHVKPELDAVLSRRDTRILSAYRDDDRMLGWIAFSKLWGVPALHWVHTRFSVEKGGEELRRRGIMTALLEAAALGDHWFYTFKGPAREFGNDKRTSDEKLVEILRRRGVWATFNPYREWSKP